MMVLMELRRLLRWASGDVFIMQSLLCIQFSEGISHICDRSQNFSWIATECQRRQPIVALFGSSGGHGVGKWMRILFWLRRSELVSKFCNQLN